ncbi:MAG: hypothetical protein Q8873_08875 [Bacillota bacterium]|nr:hypothetical protein [Bacillota bacterium]
MECPRNFDCFGCVDKDTLNCPIEYEKREDAYMEDIFGDSMYLDD